jgi:hypothetical protein
VPPAPRRSARGTASQRSGRLTGQRGSAGLPPPRAGLPGHIYHAEARAPANTPAAERSAARKEGRRARAPPRASASAPGARGPAWLLAPAHPTPAPCSPPAVSAASVCCARRQRARPPPGAPKKQKTQPGQTQSQCSSGVGLCGQGQVLRCAPGGLRPALTAPAPLLA